MSSSESDSMTSEEGNETDEEVAIAQILSFSPSTIRPYMFEPKIKKKMAKQGEGAEGGVVADPEADVGADGQDPGQDPTEDRVGNSDWCQCGRCEPCDQENSFCCRECPELETLRQEEPVNCCTDHSGVRTVATNRHVLIMAFNSNRVKYRQRRGRNNQWTEHEKMRHVAYGSVVALAWGHLGRRNRVPLPSCVMRLIHEAFPSEDGQYTGYRPADEDSD